ncbi:MAG TPA: histidine kinase, partial [Chitinophagaceae bacterium]|nr:histidine kinase [Chitinophagaceae bacterium]
GLLQYQIHNKKFIRYGVNDGLSSDYIESLSPVVNNILWIAQRRSLGRFDITTKKIKSYGYHDGLPLHKPTSFSIYYDIPTNFCYLLCKNDIVRFDFLTLDATDNSSDLFIQKVLVNNDKTFFNPIGSLVLKPFEKNLVIHYTVIDFESGDDYNFAYRLSKTDTWINLGKQRSFTLANLNPGSHSLELKATAISGAEKTREFKFTILQPFWKTTWFIVLAASTGLGLLYMLYRIRIRQIRQKSNIDKLLAKTEMKALHAQMNPHFIFNCLNSIREMILHNENEQASLYLGKFARLIRITLNQSAKQFVSLTDTIDYLERYIEMEKIRSSHFTYTLEVAKDLNTDDVMVPPMLIQPFIENAIWHGASPKTNMDIHISFRKKGNELICIVDDNGIGIEASLTQKQNIAHEPSVGIANIRQR